MRYCILWVSMIYFEDSWWHTSIPHHTCWRIPDTSFPWLERFCQCDPLSPLLFISIFEVISRKLQWSVVEGEMELYINGGTIVESCLAYVDDVHLFSRASLKSMVTLKNILNEFYEFYELTINVIKSHIYLKALTTRKKLLVLLGCLCRSFPSPTSVFS